MKFEDWIKQVISSGNLCNGYEDKVSRAASRKQLIDIVCDANGISYLCEMNSAGYPLPYEVICNEFKYYINGKYKAEFVNEKGNGYTSSIYCCYNGELEIDTTLICLLGCNITNLKIKENGFARIYMDKNCIIDMEVPPTSLCIVEVWGDSQVYWNEGAKVELINH